MNKKGFSLVEMLLVLVLIAIVSMIILPNINKMLKSNKEKEIEGYKKLITENLNMYVIDKEKSIGNSTVISFEDLKNVNPDIDIDNCTVGNITITKEQKDTLVSDVYGYSFDFCLTCNGEQYCNN